MAITFWRADMNKRSKKGGYGVDSAVMFEAVVPDQNKCVSCNTMEQDHKQNKRK